jgi:hypothetical protein
MPCYCRPYSIFPVLRTTMTHDVPTPTRYNMYVESAQLDNPRFNKVFRRRFRMPYESFKMLDAVAEHEFLFKRWKEGAVDVARQPAPPLPLLILCAIRYLGRCWTFDDLSKNTGISEEIFSCVLSCLYHIRQYQAVPTVCSLSKKCRRSCN